MDSSETIVMVVVLVCLGVGLLASIIGIFLFNNFNWWDKL